MQSFTQGITIRSLNPDNYAMCNDYMDNVWTTGIQILPEISKGLIELKVVSCFTSASAIRAKSKSFGWRERKVSQGLAISLTWYDWKHVTALAIAKKLLNEYHENVHVYINDSNKTITIYRRMRDNVIKEIVQGHTRTIFKL